MGMTSEYCADQVFEHVREGKFYCLLDNTFGGMPAGLTDDTIKRRYDSMTQRNIVERTVARNFPTKQDDEEGEAVSSLSKSKL